MTLVPSRPPRRMLTSAPSRPPSRMVLFGYLLRQGHSSRVLQMLGRLDPSGVEAILRHLGREEIRLLADVVLRQGAPEVGARLLDTTIARLLEAAPAETCREFLNRQDPRAAGKLWTAIDPGTRRRLSRAGVCPIAAAAAALRPSVADALRLRRLFWS